MKNKCKTCNGTGAIPNPNGIGVVLCPDCQPDGVTSDNIAYLVIILFTILAMVFGGCTSVPENVEVDVESEITTKPGLDDRELERVRNKYMGTINLDKCTYYVFNAYSSYTLTHADGLCKNPIHKCSCK